MKKFISILVLLSLLTFGFSTAEAQYRCRRVQPRSNKVICVYKKRSWWDKHRDKATVLIGGGSGAIIGSAVGGKKGAVFGTIIGGTGAALYTYKLRRNRHRRSGR